MPRKGDPALFFDWLRTSQTFDDSSLFECTRSVAIEAEVDDTQKWWVQPRAASVEMLCFCCGTDSYPYRESDSAVQAAAQLQRVSGRVTSPPPYVHSRHSDQTRAMPMALDMVNHG